MPLGSSEWSAERLCDALTGIWEGQSVPQSGDVTVWEETALRVRATPEQQAGAAARGELVVSAKGISMWRSHRVEFDVQGTLDPGSGRLRFTKQHKGAFTNSVVYHARVVAAAAAAERGEGKEEEKNGAASAPAPAELAVVGEYSVQDSTGLLLLKRVARALGSGRCPEGYTPGLTDARRAAPSQLSPTWTTALRGCSRAWAETGPAPPKRAAGPRTRTRTARRPSPPASRTTASSSPPSS